MIIYGPYTRKDGRQIVILYDGIKRSARSYPKFLMEQKLGRELDPNLETIDHINGNFLDNREENLRIIPRKQHCKEDAFRVKRIIVYCLSCNLRMSRRPTHITHNSSVGKAGPFCRVCAGKYGAELQNERIERLPPQPKIEIKDREYYQIKDKSKC